MGAQREIVEYSYDHNGNMISKLSSVESSASQSQSASLEELGSEGVGGAALYEYDVWNNLVKTIDGQNIVEMTYNGDGQRVSKGSNGSLTRHMYESDQVILEVDGAGNQTAYNMYGTDMLKRNVDGESLLYLYNGYSDVTALMTSSGSVAASYYYDAFGNITETSGQVNNPFRYAGYQYDEESKLYYLNARFYDPDIVRFIQEDTYWNSNDSINDINVGNKSLPHQNAIIQSLNLYAYALNNPIKFTDPTGYFASDTDKLKLTPDQQKVIENATFEYYAAKVRDDASGMKAAYEVAEELCNSAGYSGDAELKVSYTLQVKTPSIQLRKNTNNVSSKAGNLQVNGNNISNTMVLKNSKNQDAMYGSMTDFAKAFGASIQTRGNKINYSFKGLSFSVNTKLKKGEIGSAKVYDAKGKVIGTIEYRYVQTKNGLELATNLQNAVDAVNKVDKNAIKSLAYDLGTQGGTLVENQRTGTYKRTVVPTSKVAGVLNQPQYDGGGGIAADAIKGASEDGLQGAISSAIIGAVVSKDQEDQISRAIKENEPFMVITTDTSYIPPSTQSTLSRMDKKQTQLQVSKTNIGVFYYGQYF